jgi:membrane associated rhomboid family serine protease
MVPSYIKENGAFYVLFTSLFLSLDFMNFLINCICIMILASTVEGSVGSYCTAVICLGGGIMGALFGAMAHCCNE